MFSVEKNVPYSCFFNHFDANLHCTWIIRPLPVDIFNFWIIIQYICKQIFFSLYFLFNQTIWNDNITSIMPKIRNPKCINAWCKSRKNCDEKPQNLSSRIRNYLYLKCAKQFLIDQSAVAGRQSHQTMGRKIG